MENSPTDLARFQRPPDFRIQLAAYGQRLAGLRASVFEMRSLCTQTMGEFDTVAAAAAKLFPAFEPELGAIKARCHGANVICVETMKATADEIHSAVVQIQCFLQGTHSHITDDRLVSLLESLGHVCLEATDALNGARAAIDQLRVAGATLKELIIGNQLGET